MGFKRYICWKEREVYQVLNPDAEHITDEVFLGVHSEHPLWMVDPADFRRRWSQGARDFLAEFLNPNRTHVQAAVIGGSGSGKSHLIHWMGLQIPSRQDRYVLSIARSGTSLRGILESIIGVMPEDRQRPYRERLERAGYHNQNEEQRRERLLDEIALAIQDDQPRADELDARGVEQWLIEGLPNLFHDPYYRTHYAREQTSIVNQLVRHVTEAPLEYSRLTERRAFNLGDLPRQGVDVSQMARITRDFFGPLLGLPEHLNMAIHIINRNLDSAIERMLNFTADQLIQLMQDVRRFLRQEGKSLILLIEDFARMQGIDTALLEALIEAAEPGEDELCELRWAMAVTTGYYELLPNTVLTRMNFVIDMSLPAEGDRALIRDDDVVAFAARYLNAVRLGTARLRSWYDGYQQPDSAIGVPNYCQTCEHLDMCHEVFGQAGDVGLYPFTRRAIANMSGYKKVTEDGFNPRRLIKDVLAEVLDIHGSELAEGRFPSPVLRQKMVEQGRGLSPAYLDSLQKGSPEHFERLRTVLELWGSLDTPVRLPDGLYEAFDLPVPQTDGTPPPLVPPIVPPVAVVVPTILDRRVDAIRSWANGASMSERELRPIQQLVYDAVVSFVDWDAAGLEKDSFTERSAIFRSRHILFRHQQTSSRTGAVTLLIPLTEEPDELRKAAMAIEGLLQFEHRRDWDFPDAEQYFVVMAECLKSWSKEIVSQLRRVADGATDWNPLPMSVELLAVGSALGGCLTDPNPTPAQLVDAIFAPWPASAPAQSQEWKELYRKIFNLRDTLLQVVRSWASGTKGGETGGFLDAQAVMLPLQELRRSWLPAAAMPPQVGRLRSPYDRIAALHVTIRETLAGTVEREWRHRLVWLKRVRQHLSPDDEVTTVIELLGQLRDSAVNAGLRLDSQVLTQFDSARSGFESASLESVLDTTAGLSQKEAHADLLCGLASSPTQSTITATNALLDSASTLLNKIDGAVRRELQTLETDGGGNVAEVQRWIRDGLGELARLLSALGGDEC